MPATQGRRLSAAIGLLAESWQDRCNDAASLSDAYKGGGRPALRCCPPRASLPPQRGHGGSEVTARGRHCDSVTAMAASGRRVKSPICAAWRLPGDGA